MRTRKTVFRTLFMMVILAGIASGLTACSSDDNGDNNDNVGQATGDFFLGVKGTSAEFIIQAESLEEGEININTNVKQLEMTDYLWTFNDGIAVGLVYQQGDPGIGYAFSLNAGGNMQQLAKFQVSNRFTSYGFFDHYLVTSVGGQTPVDENGNALLDDDGNERGDGATFVFRDVNQNMALAQETTFTTKEIAGNGEQITFSGIVDLGNGEFLTAMVQSQYLEASASNGGSSTGAVNFPDSIWVAAFDKDMNLKRVYRDDRLSYSSGRYRSQYYSQMAKANDGTVYVFSGAFDSNTTRPAGALRIKSGATAFDPDYFFNIQAISGYKFKRVWHISGNLFLLETYNDTTPTLASNAFQYGIADMEAQTFNWITGLPSKGTITYAGIPLSHNGKVYLPLTETNVGSYVYVVNPQTFAAEKGAYITGATEIRAIGYLGK